MPWFVRAMVVDRSLRGNHRAPMLPGTGGTAYELGRLIGSHRMSGRHLHRCPSRTEPIQDQGQAEQKSQ